MTRALTEGVNVTSSVTLAHDTSSPDPGNRSFTGTCACGSEATWTEDQATQNEYHAKFRGRGVTSSFVCGECGSIITAKVKEPLP